MSDSRVTHPIETPQPPYFRGVSFLDGGVGDLLYGSYGRSYNTLVADATSLKKRSGYTRAFDETFCGRAAVAHHREAGLNYSIVADGEGIKVLTALVPKKGGGDRFEHVSYPVDDFNRADNTTVNTSDSGGDKYWREGAIGHPSGSGTVYSGWGVVSNACQMAPGAKGSLDIHIPTPSPYYVQRIELDFTAFDAAGSGNSNFSAHLGFGHGLPDAFYNRSGVLQQYPWRAHDVVDKHAESQYHLSPFATGHNTGAPWMGAWWDVKVWESGGVYYLAVYQWHFFSSFETNERPDDARQGLMVRATSASTSFATLGNFQDKHYLEIGRAQVARDQVLCTFNFWKHKNAVSAKYAKPSIEGARINTRIDAANSNHAGWHYVIASPSGNYGQAGMWGRVASGTSGVLDIDNSTVAGGFLA